MDFTTSFLIAIILLILTFCLYNWTFPSWDYWTSRGIPSVPGTLPIVGDVLLILDLQQNLASFCKSIYDENPNKSMVGFYDMKKPVLMLRELELVKTVLKSSFSYFQDNESILDLEDDPLLGRHVFFTRGQAWKESRGRFMLAFTGKRLKVMSIVVSKECKKLESYLTEKLKNNDYLEVEAKFLFARYATEVAASTVLSIEGNSYQDDYKGTLLDSMKSTMDITKTKMLKNMIMLLQPTLSRFMETSVVPPEVDKFYRKLVQEVEDSKQEDGIPRNDVLEIMNDMQRQGNISKSEVLGITFAFFIESYATSSLVLSFVCYEIAKHPDVQNRLRAEIKTVLANHEGQLTYDAINEMNYGDQVVNETLRLFPPGGTLSKLCTKEYRLEGSDGLNLIVEPGTTVIIPVLALHMDPDIWEKPEEFNPNRFEKSSSNERPECAFLPFGKGPRMCLGSRYALIQIKAAIATIVNNYRVELSPKMEEPLRIDPTSTLINCIGGLWIRLRPL